MSIPGSIRAMASRLCQTFLCRSLRCSTVCKLTVASAQSCLRLRAGLQTSVPRSVFLRTPSRLVSSDAFLERLQRGRASEDICHQPASVRPDSSEQFSLLMKNPDQPENPKSLKVSIVGAPNAGKSTLTNQLIGKKLFAVSEKVHTTRSSAVGILTEDDTQIILLDTPGLITTGKAKKHQLEESLLVDPYNSLQEADLVIVLVDVSDKWCRTKLDYEVLKCLALNPNVPAVLVLNKVDLLKNKASLLDITSQLTEGMVNGKKICVHNQSRPYERPETQSKHEKQHSPGMDRVFSQDEVKDPFSKEELKALKNCNGWPHFMDIFMLSSIDREDVETLKTYLFQKAKPQQWQYHSDVLTEQTPEEMCFNTVREKLLHYLPKEVPYTMSQQIEIWKEAEDGVLDIALKLHVKKDSHMKMVIGPGGQRISRIILEAQNDLRNIFLCDVRLKISAKLKK